MANEKSSAETFLEIVGTKDKEKTRTSFDLSSEIYEDFKLLCKIHNVNTSDLVDRLMNDINTKYVSEIEKAKKDLLKKPA